MAVVTALHLEVMEAVAVDPQQGVRLPVQQHKLIMQVGLSTPMPVFVKPHRQVVVEAVQEQLLQIHQAQSALPFSV